MLTASTPLFCETAMVRFGWEVYYCKKGYAWYGAVFGKAVSPVTDRLGKGVTITGQPSHL
jgi:hypothetical protein